MSSGPAVGETFARIVLPDLHGDQLDLYDFAGHDGPVVIELGAGWCTACQQQASWLSGQPSYVDAYSDEDWYTELPEALRQGCVHWVTILDEDSRNQTADAGTLDDWHDAYPNDAVALMLDADMKLTYRWNQRDDLGDVIANLMETL